LLYKAFNAFRVIKENEGETFAPYGITKASISR
jgi:hypothetical protein